MTQQKGSRFLFGFLLVTAMAMLTGAAYAQTGIVTGKVIDAETGDALPGVNVIVTGTDRGAATDLDGVFRITRVPAGSYSVAASFIGYAKMTVENVQVVDAKVTTLNFTLAIEAVMGEEVVIEAAALKNSEGALLKDRQKAAAVSDAISAETISRAASSDAAQAMSHVTGASVLDGKYVYIRGLGDRYTSTQLNGAELPSTNPYKKTVQMDLFPANLLDNIVTTKTFTPDKPGNFTGGSINVNTKAFPESFTLSFSTSTSYNTQASFNDNFLTYPGGNKDWIAFDDGTRAVPNPLESSNLDIPTISSAFRNTEAAYRLDALSKSFNSVMAPTTKSAPLNYGYNFSLGNQVALFGRPLGFLASLTYGRSMSSYEDGISAQYQLTGKVAEVDELTNVYRLDDFRSADEVTWGGLANMSYKFHPHHTTGIKFIYNRSGESVARYQVGPLPRDLPQGTLYETRVLQYTERELRSMQFNGAHHFDGLLGARLEWNSALTHSRQEEPDLRFFSNQFASVERQGVVDTLYTISVSNYSRPARFFRDLQEKVWDSNLDLIVPFRQWSGMKSELKFGAKHSQKDRTFRERRFEYYQTSRARYDGDPDAFFSPAAVGIVDSANGRYTFGNYIVDASQMASNYDGDEEITAYYGMVDLPILPNLRMIAGARYETSRVLVLSQDQAKEEGTLNNKDLLPSVNAVYQIGERMNVRAAYGKTLARPNLRELAPFPSFDFIGDFIFVGNPNLKRTLIDNYDLRWEWFPNPGEVLAVSGFYKQFDNPIERAIVSDNNQGQFQNVESAVVVGIEFEVRKQLDVLSDRLANFQLGGNLALIHSEVDIPERELVVLRELDPFASNQRELQGQSPFVLNLDLVYDNYASGTTAGLYFNLFGDRLSEVSLGGTPNVFEKSRATLDFSVKQNIWQGMALKLAAKNLLDDAIEKVHTYKGQEFVSLKYNRGRTFTFGVSYSVQ